MFSFKVTFELYIFATLKIGFSFKVYIKYIILKKYKNNYFLKN